MEIKPEQLQSLQAYSQPNTEPQPPVCRRCGEPLSFDEQEYHDRCKDLLDKGEEE